MLIQGYLDGLDYMKKNPDQAAELIGKFMGITGAEVKEQMSGVYNPTLEEMAKVFTKSKDTLSLYGSGAIISQVLKAKGQITTIPSHRRHVSTTRSSRQC